jgi:hypothetical protein
MTDPIKDFFERERDGVPLLAPPVGRFDELARVARHRRGRSVAVASVAAAVVVAVAGTGVVLSASGGGPTTSRTASTVTPVVATTTTTTTIASAIASPTATPADLGPVPADFHGWSVTFVSDAHGWAVGDYPCSGGQRCLAVVETTDDMASWHVVAKPAAAIAQGMTSSNAVLRFADARDGWLVGGYGVWSTHDGGRTWASIAQMAGQGIDALEAHGSYTYAVGSDGSDLWVSRDPATDNWSEQSGLGLTGSGHDTIQIANKTVLAARTGAGQQVVRVSHDNGTHWSDAALPCATEQVDLVDENITRSVCTDHRVISRWWDGSFADRLVGTVTASSGSGPGVATSVTNDSDETVVAYSGAGIWTIDLNASEDLIVQRLQGDAGYVGLTANGQGIALPATPATTYWKTIDSGTSWIPEHWAS